MAKRVDRMQRRRFPRRIKPEEHAGDGGDARRQRDRFGRDRCWPLEELSNAVRHAQPHQDTDRASGQAEDDGFDEKLRQDIDVVGADRQTPRAFARLPRRA